MKRTIVATAIICFLMMAFNTTDKKINWLTSYKKAMAEATMKKKSVLIFFHGSDWCPPCMKMQQDVFSDKDFIRFAADKLIFLDIDFPYKKKLSATQIKHNAMVKKKFGLPAEYKEGFPQLLIVDAAGNIIYQEKGYDGNGPAHLKEKIGEVINKTTKF